MAIVWARFRVMAEARVTLKGKTPPGVVSASVGGQAKKAKLGSGQLTRLRL